MVGRCGRFLFVRFLVPLRVGAGQRMFQLIKDLLDVAVHAKNGTPYDYWRGACRFRVDSTRTEAGLWAPERSWGAEGGVRWDRT